METNEIDDSLAALDDVHKPEGVEGNVNMKKITDKTRYQG